jgi:hypothetical protein
VGLLSQGASRSQEEVMNLRVWWKEVDEKNSGFFTTKFTERTVSGIVISEENFFFTVRTDKGEFLYIAVDDVIKSEWVDRP